MMRYTKIAAGLIAVLVSLSIVVLGPKKTWDQFDRAKSRVEGVVNDSESDADVARQFQNDLRERDARIGEAKIARAKIDDQLRTGSEDIDRLERVLAKEKTLLGLAADLLKEGKSSYVISGKSVGRPQLVDDSDTRLAHCEQVKRSIETNRKIVGDLQTVATELRASLAEAERERGQLIAEFEALMARLAAARARGEVEAIRQEVRGGISLDRDPKGLKKLRDIVIKAENGAVGDDSKRSALNWTPPEEAEGRIRKFLNADENETK